jgi:two-component system chemotaxis sensor kinase CheA
VIGLAIDNELLNEFILEAKGHLAEIEAGLLRMEENDGDDDTINEIFRAAHSIKGTAGFFELNKIVELAHSIESLFGEIRDHHLTVNSEMIDVLLSAADTLKEIINDSADSDKYDIAADVNAINRFSARNKPATPVNRQGPSLSAWDLWNQITAADQPAAAADSALTVSCNEPAVQPEGSPEKLAQPEVKKANLPQGDKAHEVMMEDSVRINVELLNDLLNLAGQMVLRRNQLLRISQDSGQQLPQLEVVAKGIDQLTTNLQKKVMKTRMQPIANVFNKFPRIVRDLSRKVGKEVDLVMQGINVELDRSLIEALVDPMTHLIRNALDHGIELPEIRERNHKPITGSLVLRAAHESGRVIVEVCDDGAGIDVEKVKAKAVQKGLITEKESQIMREADIINLIMTPGFSTAERVTDISGRGVGMDVVKTNIEKLGGKIEIISELGAGTTFRLTLPLTLAIISSLIVVADGQFFAVPQSNVRELLLIQAGETNGKRVEMVRDRPVLRLRGRLLPLIRLSDVLAADRASEAKVATSNFAETEGRLRVLVIKTGSTAYGLVVDSVFDTEEILVKPLSTVLTSCGLYSGVTVLGDGSVAMILDTESIRQRAGFVFEEESYKQVEAVVARNVNEEKQYLLLFRCSGSEMLALDLAMVSRVEEVDISRLQKIGAKYYFSYQGQTTRIIRPEHYLPISRKKNKPAKVYIIMPKLVKHSIGIIAEEIHDVVYTNVSLDKDGVRGKGILGSALVNDTVVTLINMHELFAEAVPEYYSESSRRITGAQSKAGKEDKRKRILVVEDTPFFLKVVKSYIESDGYEVVTAENGRQALEILGRTTVDMVVSDIEMPIMTGIELVRAIRADEALRDLPVIALTSLTGEVNKEKGLRAGFDVYEYKLDRVRLLDSIHDLCENGRKQGKE